MLVGLAPAPARDEWVVFSAGSVVLRLGAEGGLTVGPGGTGGGLPDRLFTAALSVLQEVLLRARDPLGRPRWLLVRSIGGWPAAGAALAPLLEVAGFHRDGES